MAEKVSIQGNIIQYDSSTLESSIAKILQKRFPKWEHKGEMLDLLHDPYLLADMTEAVDRIHQAKERNERVIIFWDYDVDGVTSTSILMHLLKKLDFDVSYRLPHRVHDGYGIKNKFIDELAPLWVTLIITVDCGTKDTDVVAYAKKKWIDVIVTDHHAVPDIISDVAVAVINPKRKDCSYPYKWLAGAGVAYKLMMALAKKYMTNDEYSTYLRESIDIAAIGTVADCMELTGENRTIVTAGLQQVKRSRSLWIRRLLEDKVHEDLDADVFGFHIWPRLNAAWRMDTPYKAINLLLNNGESLDTTLLDIEMLNEQRKALTTDFVNQALEHINVQDNILIYSSTDISHGIIGIVAGRITEKFYKPSIVLIDEWEKLVASCRSPEYFSIIEVLEKYKDMFLSFWWHKQAAGFSISKEKFPEFTKTLVAELNQQDFSQYRKKIYVDKCISLDEIGFKLIESMSTYKPFGMWNPKPLFMVRNFTPEKISFLGKGRDHIRFDTRYGFKIFWFWFGEYFDILKKSSSFDIVFDISEDYWNGNRWIMMKIVDIVI